MGGRHGGAEVRPAPARREAQTRGRGRPLPETGDPGGTTPEGGDLRGASLAVPGAGLNILYIDLKYIFS